MVIGWRDIILTNIAGKEKFWTKQKKENILHRENNMSHGRRRMSVWLEVGEDVWRKECTKKIDKM